MYIIYSTYYILYITFLNAFLIQLFLVDIHKDKPEETSIKSWTRFLRRNPFREEESSFLGLYHCHYRLNGKFV